MGARKDFIRLLNSQVGVKFSALVRLAEAFGFELDRTQGSNQIFKHEQVPGLLNLQERKGEVKPYQVKQFLTMVETYGLRLPEEN